MRYTQITLLGRNETTFTTFTCRPPGSSHPYSDWSFIFIRAQIPLLTFIIVSLAIPDVLSFLYSSLFVDTCTCQRQASLIKNLQAIYKRKKKKHSFELANTAWHEHLTRYSQCRRGASGRLCPHGAHHRPRPPTSALSPHAHKHIPCSPRRQRHVMYLAPLFQHCSSTPDTHRVNPHARTLAPHPSKPPPRAS